MKKLIVSSLLVVGAWLPGLGLTSGPELKLDRAPAEKFNDVLSLQRGAKVFVNYCLNCHSASYYRYNRLRDIGLSDEQIKDNLLFTSDKVGDLMRVAMTRQDAAAWFGAAPPDLGLVARARSSEFGSGADWLYTYLRTFYRDPSRPTAWNNLVFENVGMPHVLWELQGDLALHLDKSKDAHGNPVDHKTLQLAKPGKLNQSEYDSLVGDLVAFLVYVGEPVAVSRKSIGIGVILFLSVLAVFTYLLKREYWKDIH